MSDVVESGGPSAGDLIRQAREASGMHIAALAVALKVPVSKLEALESDNYDALPDTVFVRALASSICRTLKLDPAPVLSRLPQSQSPRLAVDSSGLNAPVKRSAGKGGSSSSSSSFSGPASRSLSWIVLALLVGALVLVFYPRQTGQPQQAGISAELGATTRPAAREASEPPAAGSAEIAPAAAPSPAAVAPEATAPAVPSRQAAAAVPVAGNGLEGASASAAQPVTEAASVPAGVLVLRARAQSWVQVREANGTVALQRNLTAGESVSVAGSPPFSVVVGRADATEVFVRGKAFDMTAVSRENVARFEVK